MHPRRTSNVASLLLYLARTALIPKPARPTGLGHPWIDTAVVCIRGSSNIIADVQLSLLSLRSGSTPSGALPPYLGDDASRSNTTFSPLLRLESRTFPSLIFSHTRHLSRATHPAGL
ncbi:hypothetical protein B0H13DRAFT_1999248 [Mycena leptocephala]|nr:hypothetical protein B0H13DRAFT_1999248 [Mycena leptocephala]